MKNTLHPVRWTAALLTAALFLGPAAVEAQDAGIAGSTVLLAGDIARLELEMSNGQTTVLELNTGHVLIDGADVGSYEPGGAFERSWRDLLRNPMIGEIADLPALLSDWEPAAGGPDGTARTAILGFFDRFDPRVLADAAEGAAVATPGDQARVTIVPRAGSIGQLAERLERLSATLDRIAGEQIQLDGEFALVVNDDYRIAEGTIIDGNVALLEGDLLVVGEIDGDVLVLGGELDLEPGAIVTGDVRSVGGDVETTGAVVMGEILSLTNIAEVAGAAVPDIKVELDVAEQWNDRNYGRRDHRRRGFFGSIAHNIG
ncbi:MAG: hypothetical protein ACE5FP_11060, partial [Gemmatimonadota bacterium]